MSIRSNTTSLRHMMRPYRGSKHTVVRFSLRGSDTQFTQCGAGGHNEAAEDLIFEIGSITKVFTAILLCVLIEDGSVDPRAPMAEMGDALSAVPSWVTPENLISHTSGLPNIYVPIWKALFQQHPEGPYASFTRADLLNWLGCWRGKDPGANPRHRYSNLGVGLLGEAMAMQQGVPFADLMEAKVIRPLGLTDTTGHLNDGQRARFMHPRDTSGKPVAPWTFDVLAGAGYLRSTARDLVRLSQHSFQAINAPETALDHALCRAAQPLFGLGRHGRLEPMAQCYGWMSSRPDKASPRILFANGGTAGSTCALYICPKKEKALGILSNNGVAANLWASAKLSWSDPIQQAHRFFANP